MGTNLPVSVGGAVTARWSNGLRLSSGLGYLPRSYVALINEAVQQFPYSHDAATGDLIEETLQNSPFGIPICLAKRFWVIHRWAID